MTARTPGLLVLLTAILVLAGCSNHSGLTKHTPPAEASGSDAVSAPDGLAGSGASRAPSTSPLPSASTRPQPTPGSSTSAAAGTAAGTSAARRSSGRPAGGRTTSSSHGGAPSSQSSPAPPHPTGPRVSVSPSAGLTNGQTVAVSAAGFPASTSVQIAECPRGGICSLVQNFWATTDSSGRVSRMMRVADSVALTRCGSNRCVISATAGSTSASAPISFG